MCTCTGSVTTKHGNVVTYREGIPLIKSGDPYYTFLVRGCDKINTLYLRLLKVYDRTRQGGNLQ